MVSRLHGLDSLTRVVIKIGSALLTDNGAGLNEQAIEQWVKPMADMSKQGVEVVLVSSGAVAVGMQAMGWQKRPTALAQLQAAAAVGQAGLMQTYQSQFKEYNQHTAQVLLTQDDLANRKRYLNVRETLNALLALKVLPVVNENDVVANEELCFGDNDQLAAMVATIIQADLLIILTDQDGMYDKNPRQYPDAQLIHEIDCQNTSLLTMAGEGGALGRGGMISKVKAARLAGENGIPTVIAGGHTPEVLSKILAGEHMGTLMTTSAHTLAAHQQWLNQLPITDGYVTIKQAVIDTLKSQLDSVCVRDIQAVAGFFGEGDIIYICNNLGQRLFKGLCGVKSSDLSKICGLNEDEAFAVLGYRLNQVVIKHCDLVKV